MKKKIKVTVIIILFVVIQLLVGKILRYILIDDVNSYSRLTFHEMYNQENIDILFVGSSHCYRSFDTKILDEQFDANTFNVGTASQFMDGSYMVIKEVVKRNDIKHIYLEMYYGCANDVIKNRSQMTATYIISDYIKPSVDKLLYMLSASNNKQYVNSFIVARRGWGRLFDIKYIEDLINRKNTSEYKNYEYIKTGLKRYAGKGYITVDTSVNNWDYFSTSGWDSINTENISDDWYNSLMKIIDFCRKKDIEITLVTAPMPNFLLAGNGNYDEYVDYVKKIANEEDLDYFDFNLCKEKYIQNKSELFADSDHLNSEGAEIFSQCFADFINGKISYDDLFYKSYKEKMDSLPPTVFGVSYFSGNEKNDCKIVSNKDTGIEYKIEIIKDDGEVYSVQDYSENTHFEIPESINGKCQISYRLCSSPENIYVTSITMNTTESTK